MERGLLDNLYQILASPSKALEQVSNRKSLGWAVITAVFIAVVVSLAYLPNPPELVEVIFDMEKGSVNLALVVFLWVIIFLVALFIEGGVLHLIAVLLRGRGSYLGMVCGLCFACFPFVFFAPMTLLRALLGASGIILYPIGSMALFLWVFVLSIIAIRQNYHFSLGRAITTYFVPNIMLIVIPLVVITVLIAL